VKNSIIREYFASVTRLCENTIIFIGKFSLEKVNEKRNDNNGTGLVIDISPLVLRGLFPH
jgi:hypothetical protein